MGGGRKRRVSVSDIHVACIQVYLPWNEYIQGTLRLLPPCTKAALIPKTLRVGLHASANSVYIYTGSANIYILSAVASLWLGAINFVLSTLYTLERYF